ncbi:MAG TPA: right-handed parallel beta-helix repeat-containing protein [Thermoanaerobaculia bacterium]
MRGLAWVLLFFFVVAASPLSAAFAVVDCTGAPPPGSFPSVAAALATLDEKGPNTITVNGTCTGPVSIQYRDRLTIAGSPGARLQTPSGTVLLVSRSRGFVLRDIAVSGGSRAVWVTTASDATLEGVVLENSGTGLTVDDDSLATVGGPVPARAVTIRNNGSGVLLDDANLLFNGNVTIENSTGNGIDAERARVAIIGSATAPNVIQTSGNNGVFAHGGTNLDLRGTNSISDNVSNGILAFENTIVDVISSTSSQTTTIDGNGRGGVALIFNSSGRLTNAIVTGNGNASDPLSSGVTSDQNSSVTIFGTTISGTVGPGLLVDSGGAARLNGSTIAGGTSDPIRVVTGGILELQTGNTISGAAVQVACDDSAVLFGSGSDVKTSCKKTK